MTARSPDSRPFGLSGEEFAQGMDCSSSRCLSGDRASGARPDIREQLVELLPRLRRFAFSLVREHDACNDLVQETCARALAKAELWEDGTRLDSWLFRMMQNLWLDRVRADRRIQDVADVDEIGDLVGEDGRDVTAARLDLATVMAAMEKLKPDHQVIIALTCIDGMAYKEAAEVLGLPIGTVMSRLSRARLELQRFLDLKTGVRRKSDAG